MEATAKVEVLVEAGIRRYRANRLHRSLFMGAILRSGRKAFMYRSLHNRNWIWTAFSYGAPRGSSLVQSAIIAILSVGPSGDLGFRGRCAHDTGIRPLWGRGRFSRLRAGAPHRPCCRSAVWPGQRSDYHARPDPGFHLHPRNSGYCPHHYGWTHGTFPPHSD